MNLYKKGLIENKKDMNENKEKFESKFERNLKEKL